jgi:hypothetical protein
VRGLRSSGVSPATTRDTSCSTGRAVRVGGWFFRIASIAVPVLVFVLVRRAARELAETELHPFRLDG